MSLPSSCGCPGYTNVQWVCSWCAVGVQLVCSGCAVVLDRAQSRHSRGVATMTTRGCTRRWFVGRVDRDGSREAVEPTLSIQYSQRKASYPQTQPCFTPCTCLALRSSLSTRSCATATIASVPRVKPPSTPAPSGSKARARLVQCEATRQCIAPRCPETTEFAVHG
jgi:hypothetical protein